MSNGYIGSKAAGVRLDTYTKAQVDDLLSAQTSDLQALDDQLDFTIIYPNGGTELSPANVAINSRYSLPNPFPGYAVIVVAEVKHLGVWGTTGLWATDAGTSSAFVKASCLSNGEIITQTGVGPVLMLAANVAGGSFGNAGNVDGPLPCRVKVWKLKGAI